VFQFQCPNGDLLQADESQVGQTCACPLCHIHFVVPAPLPVAHASDSAIPVTQAVAPEDAAPDFPFTDDGSAAQPDPEPAAAAAGPIPGAGDREPELLHIPCPNGHVLETPAEMLDQEALCPHCRTQFRLLRKDSVEYRRQKQLELERRERRRSEAWLGIAITVVVVVVIAVLILIAGSRGG
jgi:hypothetical protein